MRVFFPIYGKRLFSFLFTKARVSVTSQVAIDQSVYAIALVKFLRRSVFINSNTLLSTKQHGFLPADLRSQTSCYRKRLSATFSFAGTPTTSSPSILRKPLVRLLIPALFVPFSRSVLVGQY